VIAADATAPTMVLLVMLLVLDSSINSPLHAKVVGLKSNRGVLLLAVTSEPALLK
jgi:hypothetical protein